MPIVKNQVEKGRVCIGQAGLISLPNGTLIDQQIVKRLVGIQISSAGDENPVDKTGRNHNQRDTVQVISEPVVHSLGGGDTLEFVLLKLRLPGKSVRRVLGHA
jgi:hypothetical protein